MGSRTIGGGGSACKDDIMMKAKESCAGIAVGRTLKAVQFEAGKSFVCCTSVVKGTGCQDQYPYTTSGVRASQAPLELEQPPKTTAFISNTSVSAQFKKCSDYCHGSPVNLQLYRCATMVPWGSFTSCPLPSRSPLWQSERSRSQLQYAQICNWGTIVLTSLH